ncbi:MAG: hypothetical protein IKA79_09030 [Lentisphaeria bacterium]|nr:hypothetical protein [Lentisphaeria bacterium]
MAEKEKNKGKKVPASVIDIGAHSARMLIAEVNFVSGSFTPLEELEMPVPLGSEVFRYARISDHSIHLLCGILNNYRRKMEEYGVLRCRAIATSAVREAENAEIFIERIFHSTGIRLSILEGADEARLDYIAIAGEKEKEKAFFHAERTMIADIGTGACQISGYDRGKLLFTETLKVGTLRALELMPGTVSATARRQYLADIINKSFAELEHISSDLGASTLIVLGSSVRGLLPLLDSLPEAVFAGSAGKETHFPCFSARGFSLLCQEAEHADTARLCEKYAVSAEMAETISPCCVILDNLFHITGAEKMVIPMTSTKYLLLKDFIEQEQGREQKKQSLFDEQMKALLAGTAAKYRCYNDVTMRTASFAEYLFRRLESIHGLGERERKILHAAAMLHKCGLFINNQAYHKHSYYIIMNTQIPGLSLAERQLTALTARYHRKGLPKSLHPEFAVLTGEERSIVNKLAAILRISCALALTAATAENILLKVRKDRITVSCPDSFILLSGFIPESDMDFFRSVFACNITFS